MMERTFTGEEDCARSPIVVISYELWRRRFGGHAVRAGTVDPLIYASAGAVLGIVSVTASMAPA